MWIHVLKNTLQVLAAAVGVLLASAAWTGAQASGLTCAQPGLLTTCAVPGWSDRPAIVYRPTTLPPGGTAPVVLLLHGGSGNADVGIDATCPGADRTHPSCLHRIAERRGFILVVPNGTRSNPPAANRAWNAGGGGIRPAGGRWQCVGGTVCEAAVDDIAYLRNVMAEVPNWTGSIAAPLYAMGLSNGGALAHRLACQFGPPLVGIATVGAGNQFATTQACSPEQAVTVLNIHGTGDLCWRFAESDRTCVITTPVGFKIGALESAAAWAARNGCSGAPQVAVEADVDGDGLRTVSLTWPGCAAPVSLLQLEGAPPRPADDGAGHTYPDGHQYLAVAQIGPTLRDWSMERAWDVLIASPQLFQFTNGFEQPAMSTASDLGRTPAP